MIPTPSNRVAFLLASLVVHADELTSPGASDLDRLAIRATLADPDLEAWLASVRQADPGALPVKREARR